MALTGIRLVADEQVIPIMSKRGLLGYSKSPLLVSSAVKPSLPPSVVKPMLVRTDASKPAEQEAHAVREDMKHRVTMGLKPSKVRG